MRKEIPTDPGVNDTGLGLTETVRPGTGATVGFNETVPLRPRLVTLMRVEDCDPAANGTIALEESEKSQTRTEIVVE